MTQGPKGIRGRETQAVRPARRYPGLSLFNKEKREKDKAVKAELKELIQPRPTFEQKTARVARRKNREEQEEMRHAAVFKRLESLHDGTATGDVVTFGSELLYVPALSDI